MKDLPGIRSSRRAEEVFEGFGVVKGANGGLELFGAKKLPPGQPTELEGKIGDRTAQFTLKAVQQGIKPLKDGFHFEEEALDPEGGIGID